MSADAKLTTDQQLRLAALDYATRDSMKGRLGTNPQMGALAAAGSFYEWLKESGSKPKRVVKRGRKDSSKEEPESSDAALEGLV